MSNTICEFEVGKFDVKKFDSILKRGLSSGMGSPGKQVCIEAAICETLGMEHSDDPKCVTAAVRQFKINLNDSNWSSPGARAKGLRDLGLAQLGSLGVVSDQEFVKPLVKKTIQVLIPKLFREVFPKNKECLAAADRCEREGTGEAAHAADAAAYAADAAAHAARAAVDAAAARAAYAAAAADADAASDKFLALSASLALETLRELNSPGIALLK